MTDTNEPKKRLYPGDPGYEPAKILASGWESFSAASGTVESMNCRVCGSVMDVERGINGPTSWAEAMAEGKHLHDSFTCPYAHSDWHVQVLRLRELIEKTPSFRLQKMLEEEVAELLETRVATKKVHKMF